MQCTPDNKDIVAARTHKANRKLIVPPAVGAITLCAGIPASLILTRCYQPVRAATLCASPARVLRRDSDFPLSDSISIVRAEYARFLSLRENLRPETLRAWFLEQIENRQREEEKGKKKRDGYLRGTIAVRYTGYV